MNTLKESMGGCCPPPPLSAVFRFPKGHEAFKTATVKDLREWLYNFPDDMPVLATWEGTMNPVSSAFVEIFAHRADEKTKCLIFDVEYH